MNKIYKTCSKCKIEKEISDFHNSKKTLDGKNYWCKECRITYLSFRSEEKKEYDKQRRKIRRENGYYILELKAKVDRRRKIKENDKEGYKLLLEKVPYI